MRYVLTRNRPISSKKRRHSGRKTGTSTLRMPRQWIIDNCLEPHEYWDDWNDYRDGFRDYTDRKKINTPLWLGSCLWCDCNLWNKKNKKLVRRRKYRKRGVS